MARINSTGVILSLLIASALFTSGEIAIDFAPRENTPPPLEIKALL